MKDIIIDCFAGGGGASVGIEMALGRPIDIAINHDPDAIAMHKINHPDTLHLTEDILKVNLKRHLKWGQKVRMMWASPDCTSHSRAKGGKPIKRGLRILPMSVYRLCKQILKATGSLPEVVMMENVAEIQDWGPLDENDRPIKDRKGEHYQKFVKLMKNLGYRFECRELVAADYGAPTTRKRWYAVFRFDDKPIVWPEVTHNKYGTDGMKKWEPIVNYINFNDLGRSIFGRKKPLAVNTMNRIARGLQKFVFDSPEPFIVQVNHGGDNFRGQSIHEPIPTITQKHGYGIVSPLLIQYHSETAKNEVRGQSVDEPIMTIDTSPRYGLAAAFLTKFYKSGCGQSLLEPLHTITTSPGHFGQISILSIDYKQLIASGVDAETAQKCTWVSEFIMEYYGCGIGQSLNDLLHTVVTKDRFALITVLGNEYAILDIFLRMLEPEELKLGQGFPRDYIISFKRSNGKPYPKSEQVKRIGNSVVPIMAMALTEANCPYLKVGERIGNMMIDDMAQQLRFA
ncbi:MAG: DNA cytosine methyltransferase [Clostridium sulfidigenes]|uniref:DNA (cytosine-5-)-methyltransferase n=1 Tax=Clostridium sulfidigenes TaxID=318464 RepID=A0A927ZQZ6_9CLOT|nr:DNA cytosine methyltransferase [Clostridium sulfidigenes]